jgi:glycosyltransferase involved in cell wall biosynthesis
MIVLFSSNIDGGILQFEIQLLAEIKRFGEKCCAFIPEGANVTIPSEIKEDVRFYRKFKTLRNNGRDIKNLLGELFSVKPAVIWYLDASILSSQLCSNIRGRVIQYITIHDPNGLHPTNHISIKDRLKKRYEYLMLRRSMVAADRIYLLSPESYRTYTKLFPQFRKKADTFILGAHVPDIVGREPLELKSIRIPYFLFFGRIDKYKGIATLLKAYSKLEEPKLPLVIAGKGNFTQEERALAESLAGILLLNRYIGDDEMVWLFEHAAAVVLPYIEASQSGIIPIAYKFSVPVIASDITGLVQFIEDKKSGFICKEEVQYKIALEKMLNPITREIMGGYAKEYYLTNMDWCNSLDKIIQRL